MIRHAALATAIAFAAPVFAREVTWQFSDSTPSYHVSGSFMYDASTRQWSSFEASVNGTAYNVGYVPATGRSVTFWNSVRDRLNGGDVLTVDLSSPLTDEGEPVSISVFFGYQCGAIECGTAPPPPIAFPRTLLTSDVDPIEEPLGVPEPSTGALTLAALAGLVGRQIRRRLHARQGQGRAIAR